MSPSKRALLAAIEALPDDIDLGRIIEQIQRIHRVQDGILQMRERQTEESTEDLTDVPDMIQVLVRNPLPVTAPWLSRDEIHERKG